MALSKWTLGLLAAALTVAWVGAQTPPVPYKLVDIGPECKAYDQSNAENTIPIKENIKQWQAIVLILCFGAFALFVALLHRLVRRYVYFDVHMLDPYFDAGGDMNMALIACTLVVKWVCIGTFTWSTQLTTMYGIVGPFWFAAGASIPLFLFAIVAFEIRIKAPGAKTYLQIIYARFGRMPHIFLIIMALIANILISATVMAHGAALIQPLTQEIGKEVLVIVLTIAVAVFVVVGGVGGFAYVSFFSCILIFSSSLVYFTDTFYNPFSKPVPFGNVSVIYESLKCISIREMIMPAVTLEGNMMTEFTYTPLLSFFTNDYGIVQAMMMILVSISCLFVDQSFWQSAIMGKPGHSVFGFLTGGLCWFSLTLMSGTTFGLSYWAYTVNHTSFPLTAEEMHFGGVAAWTSQQLMGMGGDFVMFTVITFMTIMTAASQVLSISSIIQYDIYMTYLAPYLPTPIHDPAMQDRIRRAVQNEDFLEYDRRCVVWRYVITTFAACLLIPVTLCAMATEQDLPWLFQFTGVIMSGCVMPIVLSVAYHRTTTPGVVVGIVGGTCSAIISWMVYAFMLVPEGANRNEVFIWTTGNPIAVLTGAACGLFMGGILCLCVSLACGGTDPERLEDAEWEITRSIDNPIMSWTVKYAEHFPISHIADGRASFYLVSKVFRATEILAYLLGILFAAWMIVWPFVMWDVQQDVVNDPLELFQSWIVVVLILGCVATGYLVLVPIIWELSRVCCQASINRHWNYEKDGRLVEIPNEPTYPPPKMMDEQSLPEPEPYRYQEPDRGQSDYQPSTLGVPESVADGKKEPRWKTFIHLGDK